jgi:hypothetical protein
MVQLTERATAELRRLRTDHLARPQQGAGCASTRLESWQ